MPEMDGLEATRRIRSLGTQAAKQVPIVAMTANFFREDIEKCNEINQYVIKSHLAGFGFDVVIANNGQERVNIVSDRMNRTKKPFDLIFMDIYVPVMGKLDAADALLSPEIKYPCLL